MSPYNNPWSFHTPEVSRLLDEDIRIIQLFYTEIELINARKEEIEFYCANSTM